MQIEVIRFATVTSTMDVARALDERGAPEGTAVVADGQTAGRGRGDHAWFSPPGQSLYLSLLLRPALPPARAGWVTMSAALAVVDTILEIRDWRLGKEHVSQTPISNLHSPVSIKWFNDVLVNHHKVCGILAETSIEGDRMMSLTVGIGLNVNTRFDAAPEDVRARATSLAAEFGFELERADVLRRLLGHLGARYDRLMQTRASPAAEYARHVETLGQPVRVDAGGEAVSGVALRVEDDGALIVQTAAGERRVGFGEVM